MSITITKAQEKKLCSAIKAMLKGNDPRFLKLTVSENGRYAFANYQNYVCLRLEAYRGDSVMASGIPKGIDFQYEEDQKKVDVYQELFESDFDDPINGIPVDPDLMTMALRPFKALGASAHLVGAKNRMIKLESTDFGRGLWIQVIIAGKAY